ncbi:Glyoxalase/Bleomycin resistance protein/Dioxygenase superfamily protein [Mycolicibacterium rutilum]|uniref:Glyoxalase/Bleomycin resistance protein/Dioxygenase superfamily protein n=1 Tax=Mycolicibacterium rutilum TaxID=370526 RepID=A0A1H6KIF8_MYCRU|nr:VOC family protein [Mycolicibacterium rutilum]SEH72532.1 Glyoxalase/Bleomycin resistance protein/Dioxygenase superfamily protein [Mycolicibacterium rutilum]
MMLPGPIRQIGYVVTDIDRAIASWLQLGVGPWFVMRDLTLTAQYRGHPCEVTQSLALSNSGELQIELIQQQSTGPSVFTEFLNSKGEGFHQFAYWADDFDATLAALTQAGWAVVWRGGEDVGTRFAYVEPPAGTAPVAQVIEIMELTEITRGMADFVRDAAANWDGTDPVRVLGG